MSPKLSIVVFRCRVAVREFLACVSHTASYITYVSNGRCSPYCDVIQTLVTKGFVPVHVEERASVPNG